MGLICEGIRAWRAAEQMTLAVDCFFSIGADGTDLVFPTAW